MIFYIYCMCIYYLKLLSCLVDQQTIMISQLPNCFSQSSQRCEQFFFFLAALQNAKQAAFIDFERSSVQLFAEA